MTQKKLAILKNGLTIFLAADFICSFKLEPRMGIEPTTYGLRYRRSTS